MVAHRISATDLEFQGIVTECMVSISWRSIGNATSVSDVVAGAATLSSREIADLAKQRDRKALRKRCTTFTLFVCTIAWVPQAAAEQPGALPPGHGAISGDLRQSDDDEVLRRLEFITERLEDGEFGSEVWQYGFTSGYAMGVVIGTTQAGLAKDRGSRASAIVTAVKAGIGTARLLYAPHPGRHGSEDIYALPGSTPEQRMTRLLAAEAVLADVEHRAISRTSWKRHASNFGLNLLGGGIVWIFDDLPGGAVSAGLGIAVGELMGYLMPSRGIEDAADYRQKFINPPRDPKATWLLLPQARGLALQLSF